MLMIDLPVASKDVIADYLQRQKLAKQLILDYNHLSYAGLAQLFRARPCQGRGQGLESPDPHQIDHTGRFGVLFCCR